MSDLERAQEWLGCRLDVRVIPESTRIAPCPPRCALHGGSTWPCKQATRLAALLAEVRAEALEAVEALEAAEMNSSVTGGWGDFVRALRESRLGRRAAGRVVSADRLHEAARVLRERAEACLPRQGDDYQSWEEAFDADAYEQEYGGDGASDVRYIASMHPGVGLALADWLDDEAGRIELADNGWDARPYEAALRLADLILGAES